MNAPRGCGPSRAASAASSSSSSSLVGRRIPRVWDVDTNRRLGGHSRAARVARVGRRRNGTAAAPVVAMSVAAPAIELEVRSVDGVVTGSRQQLGLKVANEETANGLVHRYLVKVRRDMRRGTACTKTRAEVRGGGRKPYQQKGTGRARRGSRRSPLIKGGGVIFGPKPRDWSIKMNKKERRLALATALQSAVDDIIVCEDLTGQFPEKKTKDLVEALERMGAPRDKYCLLITKEKNENVFMAGRNIGRLMMNTTEQIQLFDVLKAEKIVIEQPAIQYIQEFYGPKMELSEKVVEVADSPKASEAETKPQEELPDETQQAEDLEPGKDEELTSESSN